MSKILQEWLLPKTIDHSAVADVFFAGDTEEDDDEEEDSEERDKEEDDEEEEGYSE